jgi:phosphoribosyl 1,2-cyclic phosphodiesterase
MLIRFWGTRGSLPVALTGTGVRDKLVAALLRAEGRRFRDDAEARAWIEAELPFAIGGGYGGHSSCVEIETGTGEFVVCDAGSGLRPFGQHVIRQARAGQPVVCHLFMSHLHWDHIMGFPFFTPAYVPGNHIHVYGCHAEIEHAFRRQQDAPSFPVAFTALGAQITFHRLEPGTRHRIGGLEVLAKSQRHAGDSYGYRFERNGRTAVYTTDSEHRLEDPAETQAFADFFRDADVVIFDAMYSLADAISVKADWGHSSNIVGVELCQMAGARHLVLFHHEPIFDDARIARIEAETRRFEEITRENYPPLRVTAAWDGLELPL